jgi:ribonuclease D
MRSTWVETDAGLRALIEILADQPAYALDTEFHRERTYHPHVALVQIAWRGGLALVDPLAVDIHPLAEILTAEKLMIAHAAQQDLEVLDYACGALPSRLFDTQLAAGFLGYGTPSLLNLVDGLLSIHLTKGDQLADWTQRPLTPERRAYAEADVLHLFALYDVIEARLAANGRTVWAQDECDMLLASYRVPPDPDTAWWKIKGSRSLRGPRRGVAQCVAAWRERRAAATDTPLRHVLPDLALAAIVQRAPRDRDELGGVRGLDGRHLRSGAAAELLVAINQGLELAPEDLRLPPDVVGDRVDGPTVTLLAAWVGQRASELKLDSALLATRGDLSALAAGRAEARLATGWRRELVYEPLQQLLRGEATLGIDPKGRVVLESRANDASEAATAG